MNLLRKSFETRKIDEESHADDQSHLIKKICLCYIPVCH